MNYILSIAHLAIIIIFLIISITRYRRDKNLLFSNYLFYLFFFGAFYISFPSIVSSYNLESYTTKNEATIIYTASIGLYFMCIFFCFYVAGSRNASINTKINIFRSNKVFHYFALSIAVCISLYIFYVTYLYQEEIINYYGYRDKQSLLNTSFNDFFKFKPLFIISSLLTFYLFLTTRKDTYILLLIPYIFVDIFLSGREYFFLSFLVFFFYRAITQKNIKTRYVVMIVFLIISVATIRVGFSLGNLDQIAYEFIFTWSTTHIIYETDQAQSFTSAINYSFMRLFPSFFYQTFHGNYISYTSIISNSNTLGWGLAGSIVAEFLSFKNNLILVIAPIAISFYGKIINKIILTKTLSGYSIFLVTLMYTQGFYRYSFLEFAIYPFYILIFNGFWIILIDLYRQRKRYFF